MKTIPDHPLVSIIIPSFNQGRFIRKTIESCLNQDYRPLEVCVIDGASTDETLSVLQSFQGQPGFSFIAEPDSGVVDAVNKGFQRVRGEIAAIQSSDDYYLPGAVSAAVKALRSRADLGFVFGDIIKVDDSGNEIMRTNLMPYSIANILSVRTWIPQPSTFFRLDLARQLGGWRAAVPYAADTDLWFRMAFITDAMKVDALFSARTMHEAQRDRQGEKIIRDYTKMIDELMPLAAAPRKLKRAAAAGILKTVAHYRRAGYWANWWCNVRAAMLHPPLLDDGGILSLVPGWWPMRSICSRLIRKISGKDR